MSLPLTFHGLLRPSTAFHQVLAELLRRGAGMHLTELDVRGNAFLGDEAEQALRAAAEAREGFELRV